MPKGDATLIEALKKMTGVNDGKTPFHIYRRKTTQAGVGGKAVFKFYVSFWDPPTGRYRSGVSSKQTSKAAAFTWAMAELAKEQDAGAGSTIGKFAQGFFDEDSEYLTHRSERGHVMSWNHRTHNKSYLQRYILPHFKEKSIAELTVSDIDHFQSWLLKQKQRNGATLGPATANHVVEAFRHVVKYAIRKRMLRVDPFVGFERLAATPRRRGTFTAEEVTRLLSLGPEAWMDSRARLFVALAACTGLRKGELQALRRLSVQELSLVDGRKIGIIRVDASWERRGSLKGTKSGKVRHVAIPAALFDSMRAVMAGAPWQEPDSFVFWGSNPGRPISHKKIDDDFTRAVRALGISDEERRTRNLTMHSLRHFLNSLLVHAGVPVLRVQTLIGHTSLKMTENYLHANDDFKDMLAITAPLLEGGEKK